MHAIIGLGHSLGISITAEGVETKEQLDMLLGIAPMDVQGWFYEKALAPEELKAKLPELMRRDSPDVSIPWCRSALTDEPGACPGRRAQVTHANALESRRVRWGSPKPQRQG